ADAVAQGERLSQVLLHLAGKGMKFTDRGGVSVVVERGQAPDEIAITVHDTGIGIDPDQRERIFVEFEQGDSSQSRKFTGTGLGLAISRHIIECMGGRIEVESFPSIGSSFKAVVALAEEAVAAPPRPDLAGSDILIVAPTPIEAPLVARKLMKWGGRTCVLPDASVASCVLSDRAWQALLV